MPGTIDVVSCINDRLRVIGVICKKSSPITDIQLRYIQSIDPKTTIAVLCIKRANQWIIPNKDDTVHYGDVVYFACASWVRGQPIVGTTSVNPVFFDPAVMWDFSNNHFKRNYFLTREEAEAALMGGADGW